MEWKTVILLDDFFQKEGDEIGAVPGGIFTRPLKNGMEEFGSDEKNILYVAMTRAKKNLVFNFALLNLLLGNGDTFERVVYMKDRKVYFCKRYSIIPAIIPLKKRKHEFTNFKVLQKEQSAF